MATGNAGTRLLFALVTALVAAPLLLPGWLPFTDLPEHAAAIATIASRGDPELRFTEHFLISWTSPFLVPHLVGAGLTRLVGDAETACRILLVFLAVGWVASCRLLFRAFRLDERLALLAALLFWNRSLVIGFLPYVASLPLLFAVLAAFVARGRVAPRFGVRDVGLAVSAAAVLLVHVAAFGLLAAIAFALAVHEARQIAVAWRELAVRVAVRFAPFVPAGVVAAAWLARGRFAATAETLRAGSEIEAMSPLRALHQLAFFAHDAWASPVDDVIGASFWLVFLVLLAVGTRAPKPLGGHPGSALPVAVALVVFLLTPFRVGTGLILNLRMAPVLGIFALLGLRPVRGAVVHVVALIAVLLAAVQCVDNVTEIRKLQRDVAGLPELLARIPRGARLTTLNFSGLVPNSAHFAPWLFVGSYHRALAGGVASFSFSELTHWSTPYRSESAPPKGPAVEPSWGMRPCRYRNARDGEYFDYVLTRGQVAPFAGEPPGPRWRALGKTDKYVLYEKDRSAPPRAATPHATPDRGPCADSPWWHGDVED